AFLVLLLAGGGFAAYWFGVKGKAGGTVAAEISSDKWETYTSPTNAFKVSLPGPSEKWDWKPIGSLKVNSDLRQFTIGETRIDKPGITFYAGCVRLPEIATKSEWNEVKQWLKMYAGPNTGTLRQSTATVPKGSVIWEMTRQEVVAPGKKGIGEM